MMAVREILMSSSEADAEDDNMDVEDCGGPPDPSLQETETAVAGKKMGTYASRVLSEREREREREWSSFCFASAFEVKGQDRPCQPWTWNPRAPWSAPGPWIPWETSCCSKTSSTFARARLTQLVLVRELIPMRPTWRCKHIDGRGRCRKKVTKDAVVTPTDPDGGR